VLYAGNLDRYQNFGLLAEAMRLLRGQLPEARLRVAQHSMSAASLAGVEHVPLADLAALRVLLAEDAVFALPRVSWSGYPMKLLNAMASGHAVVACAGAAHPIEHEVNGLVVPDNDAAAFAEALHRCLTDPALRARLGAAARQTVLAEHSRGIVAAALDSILQQTGLRTPAGGC
jgi:glycosyltransferase involved in cell wall biosynthesis